MSAGLETSALFILALPIYISLCLSLCWRWSRNAIALRFFLLSESRRTLPHPHNRLVVGSSPTGPTTYAIIASSALKLTLPVYIF